MCFLKLHIILFFCIFIFQNRLIAQPENLSFDKLSVQDGLSSSTIYCIYQDKKGFIWIGTGNGLNRYDGYKFTTYTHDYKNPFSISGDMVTSIAEDENGNLWIGVWYGGLNFFNRSTEKFYTYLNSEKEISSNSNNIWSVYIDKHKQIWAGTIGGGLYLFDDKAKCFKQFSHKDTDTKSISSNNISAIYEDSKGNLWIGTSDAGLNLFNKKDNTFKAFKHDDNNPNSIGSNKTTTIIEDNNKCLWIGTKDKGVSILAPDRRTFVNIKAGNSAYNLNCNDIRCINQDENNTIWIGTDGGGINFYDTLQKKFTYAKHDPGNPKSLSSNTVFCIFKSKDRIIWTGTFQGGLNIYNTMKYKFQPYHESNIKGTGLNNKSVMSVFEDSKGIIWVGTDGGGVNKYNPKTNTFSYYSHNPMSDKSISGNVIKSIYEDSKGNLWFGTFSNGLNLFVQDKEEFIHFKHNPSDPNSLSNNDVWDMVEDSQGNFWIATLCGGFDLLDRNTLKFKHFNTNTTKNRLPNNNIFSIIEDKRQGGLWIGTIIGLSYFDYRNNKFKNYIHNNNDSTSLSNDDISVIYQDSKLNIWVGTKKGGLNLYNPEKDNFTLIGDKDGLISNSITGILEDDQHFLWISTNKGISRFKPGEKSFTNYTIYDGLQSNEFLIGSAFKRKNGELIFGGIDGYNIIKTQRIQDNKFVPDVVITKLLILNKEVKPEEQGSPLKNAISESSELTLKPVHSVVTFEFTALNYTNSEKNQFAYKLEGFDKEWNYIGNRRLVTFTNLDPGNYVLKVKASNNDGIWNQKGVSLTIHVLPPWWKTWWFRFAFFASLSTSIFIWIRNRFRKIKMQHLMLERLVQQRTRELASEKEKVENQNFELIKKQDEILEQTNKITKQRDEIKEMSEKVHQSDEEKLGFFTNISHEIRTPLTLILGPLETLRSELISNQKLNAKVSMVQRNALKLERLVNQILDFRKSDDKNYPLRASKYDLVETLKEITSAFYDIASQNNIKFSIISQVETLEAWIDYEKFDKIMMNLLSNSFKFSAAGGTVKVMVSLAHSQGDGTTGGYACIKVEDTGSGIPPNQLDKIFERFYQADKPRNMGGTGIGLTIAKSLVELHHGKITVESEVGKGSCFTVLLPLGNLHLKSSEIAPPDTRGKNFRFQSGMPTNQQLTKEHVGSDTLVTEKNLPSVLIVEDNHDLRLYIKECLQDNYKIVEASNGMEGLEKAKTKLPNIIISDIMMPEMDGLELCRKIKSDIETSHVPVILLTAKSLPEQKLIGLETGADDYISKPFNYKELQVRINNLIKSRQLLKEKFSKDLVLKPKDITLTSTDEKFLLKAIEIVENNMSDFDFDVSKFVSKMSMSRTLIHLKLKELTNLSAGGFIRSLRLKRAAQLLLQDKVSVSEITYMVGFNDPNHFGKCFKKQFGTSPSSFLTEQSK